ncbi:MAG: hypothetical protein C0463_00940 [Idiomarina sp.]|nr:hypothetical protein [Idiomarina sp.]
MLSQVRKLCSEMKYKEAEIIINEMIYQYPDFGEYHAELARINNFLKQPFATLCNLTSASLLTGAKYYEKEILNLVQKASYVFNSDKRKVLVAVPVYNSSIFLREVVTSIVSQVGVETLIILVDDCSNDSSRKIIIDLQANYDNVFAIFNKNNRGAFFSTNIALWLANNSDFEFFIKHDSDDVMHKEKLISQINVLEASSEALLCTTGYDRIDYMTKKKVDGKKRGHNMTLYSKRVFNSIGYYDDTRFGGDSEFLERAIEFFGTGVEVHLSGSFTKAYLHDNNITTLNPLGSLRRQAYVNSYRLKHERLSNENNKLTAFNPFSEPCSQPEIIVAGMATVLGREDALQDTVRSIIEQVDLLIVYQNGYSEEFEFLKSPKIIVVSSLDTGIDKGDAGKFYLYSKFKNALYFSLDDDLIYPPDYVTTMSSKIASYNYDVVVTCHGRVLTPRIKSYYKDRVYVAHYENFQLDDIPLHFPGTGVSVFHTSRFKIDFNDFLHPNMADVWVGLFARKQNFPIISIGKKAGWITHSDKFNVAETIFRKSKNKQYIADNIVRDLSFRYVLNYCNDLIEKKQFRQLESVSNRMRSQKKYMYDFVVAIPTFNRLSFLKRLLSQLSDNVNNFRVRVEIFDDGSLEPVQNYLDNQNYAFCDLIITRSSNHGKKKYWSLVNKIFKKLRTLNSRYYLYLGDDLEVVDNFFAKSRSTWISIDDPDKVSVNLLNDGRTSCWTGIERTEKQFGGLKVFQSQWVDMIMMFDEILILYDIEPIPLSRWKNKPNLSSGVGDYLSRRFDGLGYSLYQVSNSLVIHSDHESMMNPEERKINPLITR